MNYLVKAVFSEKLRMSFDDLPFEFYFINTSYLRQTEDCQIDLHTTDIGIIYISEKTRKSIIK